MNLYEINVKDANGVNHKSKIYEIHEGEAQKAAFYLGNTLGGVKLADCTVTLIQEHAGVSKATETEQLAKIKNILRGLGPDSYCAAAFDGCAEIAEDNIRDDFVNSMKHRADSAKAEADRLSARVDQLEAELKKQTANANLARMEAIEAKKELAKAERDKIPADIMNRLAAMASQKAQEAEREALNLADKLAEEVGKPNATARCAEAYKQKRSEQAEAESLLEALKAAWGCAK